MSRPSRTAQRTGFLELTRLQLLEEDADRTDETFATLRDEIKGMTRVLTGILVSIATAAILLAVNIAIGAIGQ